MTIDKILKKLRCPTLIMASEFGSHMLEGSKEMSERIKPDLLTFQQFHGCGAPMYKDNPDQAKAVVRSFLRRATPG